MSAGVDLDLRDNVNPWGAPPTASGIMCARPEGIDLARYPDPDAGALCAAIAADAGVSAAEVVVGCGSDDVIDSFLRAVAAPGDRVAHLAPTFSMVPRFARLSGLEPVGVPLLPSGAADVDGLLATGAPVIYLCSPNNPTGTVTPAAEIERLMRHAPGMVLIDEAYAEFSGEPDQRPGAPGHGRVLVTRTFSKAWGLAGLRVGYGIGGAALVARVAQARGPYKVNAVAAAVATAALRADEDWMRARAAETCAVRDTLVRHLARRRGVRAWPSRANFVLAAVGSPAEGVAARFAELGIGVRAFPTLPGVGEAVRLGVMRGDAVERVVRAFDEVWPCE